MKAAMIGLGMVSSTFAQAFRDSSVVDLALVYSRSAGTRAGFLRDWPGPAEAQSLEDILCSDVGFVVLTTPPDARKDYVQALVAAGKPILMEKPVERSLAAATELVEMCEAQGVPLGIMLQHRARPVVTELRQQMTGLGPLHMVEVSVPWWRPQSYYDADGRGSFARDGGGVLITQAIHTLDLMLSLTGLAEAVTAMSATTSFHQMEAEDFVSAGLRFANGAVGQVFATTASFPGRGEMITLHFAQGSALLEAGELVITHHNGREERFGAAASSGAGADPMAFTSDWHRFVVEDFARSLEKGHPPLIPGREALKVHALIDAMERSARLGETVTIMER